MSRGNSRPARGLPEKPYQWREYDQEGPDAQGVLEKIRDQMDSYPRYDGQLRIEIHEQECQGPGRFPGAESRQTLNGKDRGELGACDPEYGLGWAQRTQDEAVGVKQGEK